VCCCVLVIKPLNASQATRRSSQAEMPSSTPARLTKSRVSLSPRMHSRLYGSKPVKTPAYLLNRASLTSHALEATLRLQTSQNSAIPTNSRAPPHYLAPSSLLPILYTICYIYPACTRGFIRTQTNQNSARSTNSRVSHLPRTRVFHHTASRQSKLRQTLPPNLGNNKNTLTLSFSL
jgi:hypothetical protein